MFPTFKKWFIPNEENDYVPLILRVTPFIFLSVLLALVFFAGSVTKELLTTKGSFLAAVVSSVLVDLTNFDRATEGLGGLSVNPTLVSAAQAKADDMAAKGYFAHTSPDGKTPWYWFGEAGYDFSYAGENLAVFFGDSKDVERAWMNSPGHRANILGSNFSEIGIATAEGYYQGQKTTFVVQVFGAPAVRKPLATLASQPVTGESESGGKVGGEAAVSITEENSTPVATSIIHEDEMFIAVKSPDMATAPSQYCCSLQSNFLERLIASPNALLSYVYGFIALIVVLAFIFMVFFEFKVQRPKNIILAIFLLAIVWAFFELSTSHVVVAAGLYEVTAEDF